MFLQEADLLEIRLHTLEGVVDEFGIVEFDATQSGRRRGYALPQHQARFARFPIRYEQVHVPDEVVALGPIRIEAWQRKQLGRLLAGLRGDDTVMVCDLDEIPAPDCVYAGAVGRLAFDLFYFHLNTGLGPGAARKAFVMWAEEAVRLDLHEYRVRHRFQDWPLHANEGWHFSSVGTWPEVREKMMATTHVECGTLEGLGRMEAFYRSCRSTHGEPLAVVSDERLPAYVREDRERFEHLLWAPAP